MRNSSILQSSNHTVPAGRSPLPDHLHDLAHGQRTYQAHHQTPVSEEEATDRLYSQFKVTQMTYVRAADHDESLEQPEHSNGTEDDSYNVGGAEREAISDVSVDTNNEKTIQ